MGLGIARVLRQGWKSASCHYRRRFDPRPRVFVLVYHRIVPETEYNPFATKVSVAAFKRQIGYVKAHFPTIVLADLVEQYRRGSFAAPVQVAITLDDGYRDNYCCALPVLQEFEANATFFLVTDYIGTERLLWDYELALMLQSASGSVTEVEFPHIGRIGLGSEAPAHEVLVRFNEVLKGFSSQARGEILHALGQEVGGRPKLQSELDRCMTWEEAKEMQRVGMEIGAHSLSHPSLARISSDEANSEIAESKTVIEDRLGRPCTSFAFPFGSKSDFDDALVQQVEDAGFECCALNVDGYNKIDDSLFRLRRIIVTESTDLSGIIG